MIDKHPQSIDKFTGKYSLKPNTGLKGLIPPIFCMWKGLEIIAKSLPLKRPFSHCKTLRKSTTCC